MKKPEIENIDINLYAIDFSKNDIHIELRYGPNKISYKFNLLKVIPNGCAINKCDINFFSMGHDMDAPSNDVNKLINKFQNIQGEIRPKNLELSSQFASYLTQSDKKELFPVQEVIMGGGKSEFITPLTIIRLLANPSERKNVIVCVPNSLIDQTYNILLNKAAMFLDRPLLLIGSKYTNEYLGYDPENNFLIDDNKDLYGCIIVMNDISYRSIFMKWRLKKIKRNIFTDSWTLFDEIDMIANPLTCELNFMKGEQQEILSYDILILIIQKYYELINPRSNLWVEIVDKVNFESGANINVVTKYSPELHMQIAQYIESDDWIANYMSTKNTNLIKHINANVLPYLLQNKPVLNYGIPNTYPSHITDIKYQSKAIPYTAQNTPAYGSEFSDPILTIFLTYIYTNIFGINRNIDKKRLMKHYSELVLKTKDTQLFNDIKNIFIKNESKDKFTISDFISNKLDYVEITKNFQFYTKNDLLSHMYYMRIILKPFIKYYGSIMHNISLTELLMYENVPNYICFTGTPYVLLPESPNINYPINKINYDEVETYNPKYPILQSNVAICYSINKMKQIYEYTDDSVARILELINKNKYNTLIDVGAFFIDYDIKSIVEKILDHVDKSKYKYIIYTAQKAMCYDIVLAQYMLLESINLDNTDNKFFIFDNAHITGINFKKIMNPDSVGLCTISYNTKLRDVAQGIFRMRDIFTGNQYCDFILDKKLFNDVLQSTCNIDQIAIAKTQCSISLEKKSDYKTKVEWKLYDWLCQNQSIYYQQQKKVSIKQNILGIYRIIYNPNENPSSTMSIVQTTLNFMYPSTDATSILDIDEINLQKCLSSQNEHHYAKLCDVLYEKYQKINVIKSIVSTVENQSQSQSQSENINISISEKISQLDSNMERIILYKNNKHTMENIKSLKLPTTIFVAEKVNISDPNVCIYSILIENKITSIVINAVQLFQIFATLSEKVNTGCLYTSYGILIVSNPTDFHTQYGTNIKKNRNLLKAHGLQIKKEKYKLPDISIIEEKQSDVGIYTEYLNSIKIMPKDINDIYNTEIYEIENSNIKCYEKIDKLLDLALNMPSGKADYILMDIVQKILSNIQNCLVDISLNNKYPNISNKLRNIHIESQPQFNELILNIDKLYSDQIFKVTS